MREKIPIVISDREKSSQEIEIQVQRIQRLRRKFDVRKEFKIKNGTAMKRFHKRKIKEKKSMGRWRMTQEWKMR
jgi:hypothetical protein